jgi:hypothetical protein
VAERSQEQKAYQWLLLGAFGIGCFGDLLFYGKNYGVSYPLFFIGMYALFVWQAKLHQRLSFSRENKYIWLLCVPIGMLSLTFALFSNGYFHLFNFVLVPMLFVLQTMLFTGRHKAKWHEIMFVGELLEILVYYTPKHTRLPFIMIKGSVKGRMNQRNYGVLKKIMTGLLISLPILLVVLTLLSQADRVFGHFLNEIPDMLIDVDSVEGMFRLFVIGLVTLVVFGYMYSLFGKRADTVELPQPQEQEKIVWDGIILVTILTIIDAVYAAFTYIQISYLFSGAKAALPEGLTYAEYAKNGFNELLTVTVINFIILLATLYLVSRKNRLLYRSVQVLLTLLTVCTSFMLFSAYYRLSLYEAAYGYTHTRLLAHLFMIFLLILFAIALWKIWRDSFSLFKYYALVTLASYVFINYINMDVIIAQNNLERYRATGNIDVEYLGRLSYDVVPYLQELKADESLKAAVTYELENKWAELRGESSWQSFNWSKYRAKQYLP